MRRAHFVALMDIRHVQRYEYFPQNVRESNLKCGNYESLDCDSWMRHVEKTFEILIFKYVSFDTMLDVTVKKREQRIGMLHVQY